MTTLALLAAVTATDSAATSPWTAFWHGADSVPPDGAALLSGQETGRTVLAVGFDERIVVSDALMTALQRGQRLAEYLSHKVVDPGHVVHGMVWDPDCTAAVWLGAVTPRGRAAVVRLLADRVIGEHLPTTNRLGAAPHPPPS